LTVRPRHFPLFDSLRAIAFTCVLFTHASVFAGLEQTGTRLSALYLRLDVGVEIFFAISAFLLYRPFVAARVAGGPAPLTRVFAWRRFIRIVPPYWLILTLVCIWIGAPIVFHGDHFFFFYGLAQVYNPDTQTLEALPQAWSLCVEATFYLFLPVYSCLMRRLPASTREQRVRQELIAAGVLVAIGVGYTALIGPSGGGPFGVGWHFALPAFIDYFAIGIALATLSVAYEDGRPLPAGLRVVERFPSLAWLMAAVALVAVSWWVGIGAFGVRYGYWPNVWRHCLYGVIALGVVLPAAFGNPNRGVVRKILSNRALLYIGMVSYAAYLLEFAVLTQLSSWHFKSASDSTTPYIWFVAPYILTIGLASISWYAFERPVISLKRLVKGSPRGPVKEPSLEPTPSASMAGRGSG
jgi:peptidoglycan/LPS O-acetylase OafA/YrhL